LEFNRDGYAQTVSYITPNLNGWYIGNVLVPLGSIFGLLVFDPASGAMWKLDSVHHAELVRKSASQDLRSDSVRFVLIDDIPLHLRGKMERLN
jgi:hypothetical protein